MEEGEIMEEGKWIRSIDSIYYIEGLLCSSDGRITILLPPPPTTSTP